jgi:hypothetical protein
VFAQDLTGNARVGAAGDLDGLQILIDAEPVFHAEAQAFSPAPPLVMRVPSISKRMSLVLAMKPRSVPAAWQNCKPGSSRWCFDGDNAKGAKEGVGGRAWLRLAEAPFSPGKHFVVNLRLRVLRAFARSNTNPAEHRGLGR